MFQAASLGARMAIAVGDRPLLSRARNKEGFALAQLGRFSEATIAQAEAWSLARALGDRKLEMFAIWGFSTICVAMGQWNVAVRYCELMSAMAEEVGLPQYALMGRINIADCAVQLRDPAAGLRVLSRFELPESQSWDDARLLSCFAHKSRALVSAGWRCGSCARFIRKKPLAGRLSMAHPTEYSSPKHCKVLSVFVWERSKAGCRR